MKRNKMKEGFFDELFPVKFESKYSTKVAIPIYEPKDRMPPRLSELCDKRKARELSKEIENSSVSEKEKEFLLSAAARHFAFNYDKIAEYYCHASKEMQELMESSALVIIDFEKAIEKGYVKLSEDLAQFYFNEYGNDIESKE